MARILVIDDDPTIRSLIGGLLEAAGHSSVEARDGRDGIEIFAKQAIDLVVTDIVMPEQEGIETIGALRRLSRTVPILAISGSATIGSPGDYLRAAAALGASGTLQKPFAPDALMAAVDRLLATLGC
ncbi:response regulator [Aliidongia dinghuensis]|uniref:Response regulator n=1 Tax=Aliidongia dinghuensis TaxID=1867774 RepID=A0A8J2YVD3_9PROT|nr:response regulator [Aliidongia dinghuensis]GGF23138.1 response regulator [Aliidongia dinghuensis]